MHSHPFDAIIFDHDGTLIDTETPDFQACQILFAEYGLLLSLEHWAQHAVGHMNGYDFLFAEIIQANGNGLTKNDIWPRLKELSQITLQNAELMPGVIRLLPQLQAAGYPLAVATASDRAWAIRWLNHFNLWSYFNVIATSDDIIHNKPAPDVYLFAAQQLGVPPERCLVFEDSVAGMQSAKAAGMTVIALPSHVTKSLDFSQADEIMEGLDKVSVEWITELGLAKGF